MQLFTAQMSLHKRAKKEGMTFIDITVKSGDSIFAPTWEMVTGYKNGTVSELEYAKEYHARMTESLQNHKERWIALCKEETVVLGCYCSAGGFCHRHLLAEYIANYCDRNGLSFRHGGELGK